MKITNEMLTSLAAIKTAAAFFPGTDLKTAKKSWWTQVREAYDLDPSTKYKVATTGDNAGELRYKANGEPVADKPIGKYVVIDKEDIGVRYQTADEAKAAADGTFDVVVLIVD